MTTLQANKTRAFITASAGSVTARARHVDMVLNRIESLPTLSPIALRVLQLTGSDDAALPDLTRLIESDPTLAAKVLALCRRADMGVSRGVTTIGRAVVLLGLDAIRAALLGVEVYELFKPAREAESEDDAPSSDETPTFDLAGFWRHSIAVACAAEMIAENHRAALGGIKPSEAYLCGLMHDLGKPALERTLPLAYRRVLTFAQDGRLDLASIERRVLGIDHHAAGKRLAEHWKLPHAFVDAMWLHGRPFIAVPELPHRTLIGVVTLADLLVRRMHLGWSGNLADLDRFDESCAELNLDPAAVRSLEEPLVARVAERCAALGLDTPTDRDLLLNALADANRRLARLNASGASAARRAAQATRTLDAVDQFHQNVPLSGGITGVLESVAASASAWLTVNRIAIIVQPRADADWQVSIFDNCRTDVPALQLSQPVQRSLIAADLRDAVSDPNATSFQRSQMLGRLRSALAPAGPTDPVLIELPASDTAVALLLDGPALTDTPEVLRRVWGASVQAAAFHEGAKRLSEDLAQASTLLAEAQEEASQSRVLAHLGKITAGAAHEMNNPLAVISGNAQLLTRRLSNQVDYKAASLIVRSAQRLGELIGALHLIASPPQPAMVETDLSELVTLAAKEARQHLAMPGAGSNSSEGPAISIRAKIDSEAKRAVLDPQQIGAAVTELLRNAYQSSPKSFIEVRVHVDPLDGRLLISVRDDGKGMPQQALDHAFDPFFSDQSAGRRTGLGLSRSRRFVDLHAGTLTLTSTPGEGTTATIAIPAWKPSGTPAEQARPNGLKAA